jgi:spore coat polysaccharide biosynthesis predicted glycosyltransferase SpsG
MTCEIVIIIGAKSRWTGAISASAARLPWKVTLLTNVRNMAELMALSDLAIGAAGTTALERCCLGLPSLLVILADNQKSGAYALQTLGAARLLGPPDSIASNLPRELESLLQGNTLIQMSKAAESITDGNGISRVIQRMADLP